MDKKAPQPLPETTRQVVHNGACVAVLQKEDDGSVFVNTFGRHLQPDAQEAVEKEKDSFEGKSEPQEPQNEQESENNGS